MPSIAFCQDLMITHPPFCQTLSLSGTFYALLVYKQVVWEPICLIRPHHLLLQSTCFSYSRTSLDPKRQSVPYSNTTQHTTEGWTLLRVLHNIPQLACQHCHQVTNFPSLIWISWDYIKQAWIFTQQPTGILFIPCPCHQYYYFTIPIVLLTNHGTSNWCPHL